MTKTQYDNLSKVCEVLESNKYKQGCAVLRNPNDEFCCLGVILDIFWPNEWLDLISHLKNPGYEHKKSSIYIYNDMANTGAYKVSYINSRYLDYFGLMPEEQAVLSRKNDCGESFFSIAKYIREKILTRYTDEQITV